DSRSQVESNVLQTGPIDQDERTNDRRANTLFLGLHQEALLAISFNELIVERRKAPNPLQAHDFLIQLVEIDGLTYQIGHLLSDPLRKISIHPFDRDKRRNGIGDRPGIASRLRRLPSRSKAPWTSQQQRRTRS